MQTINQRQQDKQKKTTKKPTTRQCKYEHHEGERVLPISEFYQRQSFCKKCMVKYNKKKRDERIDERIKTQYAGVDCVLNNAAHIKNSPRLFKSGLIAEAKILEQIKNNNSVSTYWVYDEINDDVLNKPPIKYFTYNTRYYVYLIKATEAKNICKFLVDSKHNIKIQIYIYGDVNEKWLPYISEAATKYQFDVGFITDEID